MRLDLFKGVTAQLSLALMVLALGTSVYVLDRPLGSAPFFNLANLSHLTPSVFGMLGQSFPTFAHAFSFSIVTATVIGGGRQGALVSCLSWVLIDAAFELGQHAAFAQTLSDSFRNSVGHVPILRQVGDYFILGTFDLNDLFSIVIGGFSAYLLIAWAGPKSRKATTRTT